MVAALGIAACGNDGALARSSGYKRSSTFGYTLAPAAKARAGVALPLGKCINMGGMLEFAKEGNGKRRIQDSDFKIIRAAGFRTVRLPIQFSAHTESKPPYQIDPAFMARVRHIVDAGVASGLNVIIDVHHYKDLMNDPDGHSDRFTAIWRQIAAEFKDAPEGVWFELLNEPGGKFWNKLSPWVVYRPALAAIRQTNPERPVVVAGNLASAVESLLNLQMPDDPYLVPTVHMYNPEEFTHQGANWTTRKYPRGRKLLGSDRTIIDAKIKAVKAYMDRTGRVPFLGEFGVIDDMGIDPAERAQYYGTVSAAFASIGVQSCAWSFTNGFDMYRNGRWMPGILKAIKTTTTR